MRRLLHVHSQARFQGGIERILFDIANSMTSDVEHGLLFSNGGSSAEFLAPFSWQGMCVSEALTRFDPDLVIIHKTSDTALIDQLIDSRPTIVFPHDHDMLCPRRHKYLLLGNQPCTRKAGVNCIRNLCFIERNAPEALIPVTLFDGISRQTNLFNSSRRASHFLVASDAMREALVINGIDGQRVRVIAPIPAAIDRVKDSAPVTLPHLLYVGQIIRGKGVDLMLQALAEITVPFKATIVGDGNHLRECRILATRLGLDDKVTFTGWVDHEQLESYYAGCRFLVVPSRWPEPFGMVGVEAMARGRPVVAFDAGGISSWLSHGDTGLLARPGDIQDLARQLHKALTNDVEVVRMGRNARLAATTRFTHTGFIQQLQDYIQEVMA